MQLYRLIIWSMEICCPYVELMWIAHALFSFFLFLTYPFFETHISFHHMVNDQTIIVIAVALMCLWKAAISMLFLQRYLMTQQNILLNSQSVQCHGHPTTEKYFVLIKIVKPCLDVYTRNVVYMCSTEGEICECNFFTILKHVCVHFPVGYTQ